MERSERNVHKWLNGEIMWVTILSDIRHNINCLLYCIVLYCLNDLHNTIDIGIAKYNNINVSSITIFGCQYYLGS